MKSIIPINKDYTNEEWIFQKEISFKSAQELLNALVSAPDSMGIQEVVYSLKGLINDELISRDDIDSILGEFDPVCVKRLFTYFTNTDTANWKIDEVKYSIISQIESFGEPAVGSVITMVNNWVVDDLFINYNHNNNCPKLMVDPLYSSLYALSIYPGIVFQQSAVGSGVLNAKERLEKVRSDLVGKRKKRNKYRTALGFEAVFLPFLSQIKNILKSTDEVAKKALKKSLKKSGFTDEFIEQLERDPSRLRKWLKLPGNFKRLTGFLLKKVHWLGAIMAAADVLAAIKTLICLHAIEDEIVDLENQESILVELTVGKAESGKRYRYLPYVEPSKLGIKPNQNCTYSVSYFLDWVDDKEKMLHSDKISGPHPMEVNPQGGESKVPGGAMIDKTIITIPSIPDNMLYGTIIAEISVKCGDKEYPTKRVFLATVRPD